MEKAFVIIEDWEWLPDWSDQTMGHWKPQLLELAMDISRFSMPRTYLVS